jgi:plasmid stabilization system protein ParE
VKLIVSTAAAVDLARLHDFLATDNAVTAKRAVSMLVAAIDSLTALPERGRPHKSTGLRELIVPFGRSCYVVRYLHDVSRDELVVMRIWHGRETRE